MKVSKKDFLNKMIKRDKYHSFIINSKDISLFQIYNPNTDELTVYHNNNRRGAEIYPAKEGDEIELDNYDVAISTTDLKMGLIGNIKEKVVNDLYMFKKIMTDNNLELSDDDKKSLLDRFNQILDAKLTK